MKRRTVLGVDAEVAESFAERAKGLIGRKDLAPGTGMLITKCNCIHTFFMRFPIDATFLDREGKVVKVVRNIRPWRPWVWGGFKSVSVLETMADSPVPNGSEHLQRPRIVCYTVGVKEKLAESSSRC